MSRVSGNVVLGRMVSSNEIGQHSIVPDRVSPVLKLAKGKRVLNIGCAGSDALTAIDPVHAQISRAAKYCVGIDIYEAGIQALQSKGHNVYYADAECFELDDQEFDLVILGDVIEHVSNPGLVFDNANRHLKMGGSIVVTTPNPFSLTLMARLMLRRKYAVNSEHVSWFDPVLLSYLMERSGFVCRDVFWTEQSSRGPLRFLQNLHPDFHPTFGIVAEKDRPAPLRRELQVVATKR